MAIYKLGELSKIVSGSKPKMTQDGLIPVVGSGGIFAFTDTAKSSGSSFTLPRKGTMKILWYDQKVWNVDTAFLVEEIDFNVVTKKFLYYSIISNSNWKKIITGSTRPSTRISDWRELELEIPDKKQQKIIIDIIKPHENLFLKYSETVNLSTFESATKGMRKIIDIIEPIETAERVIKKTKDSIKILGNYLINKIDSEQKYSMKRRDFIKIKSKKEFTNLLNPVSIGYSGFGAKRGKTAEKSKVVEQYDFAVGLISKDIPIGFNFDSLKLGISTAYYCFEGKNPIVSYYFYIHLTRDWERYVRHTSRQGQGFEKNIYLEESIMLPSFDSFKKYEDIFKLIVSLQRKIDNTNIYSVKEKVIKTLV